MYFIALGGENASTNKFGRPGTGALRLAVKPVHILASGNNIPFIM